MRLAVLSDVHGNPLALDAVVRDVEVRGGVDGYWVLGDLAALGYDPAGAIERLASLPNAIAVLGNTDRCLVTGERPRDTPTAAAAQARPELVPHLVEVERGFTWAQGYLAAGGWLAALPVECRLTLPDGARMLGVHASPGQDDGPGLQDDATDDEIAALIDGCRADLVCTGHTHRSMDRVVGGVHVLNVGSVSNPSGSDRRASYALLEANTTGYEITLHRVVYDWAMVVDAIGRSRYPKGADVWLLRKFTDRQTSPAPDDADDADDAAGGTR